MKLKSNYTVAKQGNEHVAVPLDTESGFHGIIRLNRSGVEVFRALQEGLDEEQAAKRLMDTYEDLDKRTADQAVRLVIEKLTEAGLVEE